MKWKNVKLKIISSKDRNQTKKKNPANSKFCNNTQHTHRQIFSRNEQKNKQHKVKATANTHKNIEIAEHEWIKMKIEFYLKWSK